MINKNVPEPIPGPSVVSVLVYTLPNSLITARSLQYAHISSCLSELLAHRIGRPLKLRSSPAQPLYLSKHAPLEIPRTIIRRRPFP